MTEQRPEVVTLAEIQTPELEDVRHRRKQLFSLLLLVFVLVALGVVLFSYASEVLVGRPLEFLGTTVLRPALVLLAVAFALYVWEKERTLRRVEQALIEERVLSSALENRVRELSAILRAGRAVASTLSLKDVLELILHSAQELLGATEGSVMLFDEQKTGLRVAASVGLSEQAGKQIIPIGEGIAGWVAEFREPVVLSGDVSDSRFRRLVPKDRKVRSAMSAPLYARAEPVGVLNVSTSADGRQYTELDLRALTVFAEHAAIAINNARLYQRERESSERLEEMDAQRREFLAVVTHDLKAPLTSILGYVRLLLELGEAASVEQAQQFAEVIERQGRRMLDMIEQLVVASSLDEGAPVLSREPIDLGTVVGEQVKLLGGLLGSRHIDVKIPSGLPTVYGDRGAIEQIVANLMDNAVKYSPEGTPIEVRVQPTDDEVLVSVSDQGPGIPGELLPHVFERFRRGDVASTGSVGLGLFIVRSLTQGHGGRVWVENVNGGGTKVTFTLPLRRERKSA
ncbi:MAG TPA: ATP-binding protein [Actinomycetota bacterium]|nr:ATP-binding protein [Actinomycetota bacterium]